MFKVGLAMLCLSVMWSCDMQKETPEQGDIAKAVPVNMAPTPSTSLKFKTMTVSPADQSKKISLTGRIIPIDQVQIVAEVQGKALKTKKRFDDAISYQKDELIIAIDHTQFENELKAQKSQFKSLLVRIMSSIQLDYKEEHSDWEAYLKAFDENKPIVDLPKKTNEQLDYFLSANNIYSTFYSIKSSEEQLSKFKIYAPFSGAITNANLSPGAIVSPGVPLGTLSRTDIYEYQTSISIADVEVIRKGQVIELLSVTTGQRWQGKVHRVGKTIDPATQSVPVFLRVSGQELKSGMFLEAQINAKNYENVVRIPNELLTRNNEVHVIQDSVVVLKPVEVVSNDGREVLVRGLSSGEMLIAEQPNGPIVGAKAFE